jgi:hypothetical protein
MWHRTEARVSPPADSGSEMAKLTAMVVKWGMEAGFLGLEDRLEPRLESMVREAADLLFGRFESESECLRSELEATESEWEQAAYRVAAYRSRFGAPRGTECWWTRVRCWFWDFREYRAAGARCSRCEPILREKRRELAAAERKRRQAREWCEIAAPALRARYEFEKARAAAVRPDKEMTYDTRETHQFVACRAN